MATKSDTRVQIEEFTDRVLLSVQTDIAHLVESAKRLHIQIEALSKERGLTVPNP